MFLGYLKLGDNAYYRKSCFLGRSICFPISHQAVRSKVYKYLKGGERQMDEARLFLVVCSNRTKSNGLKIEHRKFSTNMQKNLQSG